MPYTTLTRQWPASLLFALQGFLSWVTGLEAAPDRFTWTGGAVIITGIALITYSEHTRTAATAAAVGVTVAVDGNMKPTHSLVDVEVVIVNVNGIELSPRKNVSDANGSDIVTTHSHLINKI